MKLSLAMKGSLGVAGAGKTGASGRSNKLGLSIVAVFSVIVALVSMRYLIGVGPVPPIVDTNAFRDPWLVLHIAGAATALLVAPLQFVAQVRARVPQLHRWLGRLYVVGCLVGGVSGLVLATGASSGIVITLGFGSLSLIWIYVTTKAWRHAVAREFVEHRAWMIRSFALTFAAVNLRLYLPIVIALPIAFEDGYRAISFLAWVPNLVFAELYLRGVFKRRGA